MWPRATRILAAVVCFSAFGTACGVDTELTPEEQARADAEAALLECTDDQHCWDVCEERSRSVCIDGECAGCNIRQSLLGNDDDDDTTADGNAATGDGGGEGAQGICRDGRCMAPGNSCAVDFDCAETEICNNGLCEPAWSGGVDELDCSVLDDGTECAWGSGLCRDGVCMGEACWGGELNWFDVHTMGGDCLTWSEDGPGTDTYRYLGLRGGGGVLDNADCIVGIANGLWWAGSGGGQGTLRIDGKAVPEDDTKLIDAVVNGDHVLEWRGENYEMQTSTPRDGRSTEVTICYTTELRPEDAE